MAIFFPDQWTEHVTDLMNKWVYNNSRVLLLIIQSDTWPDGIIRGAPSNSLGVWWFWISEPDRILFEAAVLSAMDSVTKQQLDFVQMFQQLDDTTLKAAADPF